jgi:hypothetical protein
MAADLRILEAVADEFGVPVVHLARVGDLTRGLRRDPVYSDARCALCWVVDHLVANASIRDVANACDITWQAARYRLERATRRMVTDESYRRRLHAIADRVWHGEDTATMPPSLAVGECHVATWRMA